jgi:hypothetical protein
MGLPSTTHDPVLKSINITKLFVVFYTTRIHFMKQQSAIHLIISGLGTLSHLTVVSGVKFRLIRSAF